MDQKQRPYHKHNTKLGRKKSYFVAQNYLLQISYQYFFQNREMCFFRSDRSKAGCINSTEHSSYFVFAWGHFSTVHACNFLSHPLCLPQNKVSALLGQSIPPFCFKFESSQRKTVSIFFHWRFKPPCLPLVVGCAFIRCSLMDFLISLLSNPVSRFGPLCPDTHALHLIFKCTSAQWKDLNLLLYWFSRDLRGNTLQQSIHKLWGFSKSGWSFLQGY